MAVVGTVPAGLPQPGLPDVSVSQFGTLIVSGGALALVGIGEGLSAARLFAKGGYDIDADQELVATGAASLASGLFGGLAVAGSLSKTATAVRSQGRTRVAGLVTAAVALLVAAILAPLLSALPLAVLSAVVVHAVWEGLIDARRSSGHSIRRLDFLAAIAAGVGVLLFRPLNGLLLAIALSVVGLVYRSYPGRCRTPRPHPGEKAAYGSTREHGERMIIEGIVVSASVSAVLGERNHGPRPGHCAGGAHAGDPGRDRRPRRHESSWTPPARTPWPRWCRRCARTAWTSISCA